MSNATVVTPAVIRRDLAETGYRRLSATDMASLIGSAQLEHWQSFAESWHDLGPDRFMADGGRYRRRRFTCFGVTGATVIRRPHQPHYQTVDHNPLNGGVDRWFEPVTEVIGVHPLTIRLIELGREVFDETDSTPWHVELHQFRIEAAAGMAGKPTPEGLHRDGVDWVLVMLVGRENVAGGVTEVHDADRRPLGEFRLVEPLEAVVLDDRRVWHGVTPLEVDDPTRPAWRDVLVLTYRAERGS